MESFCSDTSKQEAVSLLEDGWFFGNLFNRKSRFTRCHSDPSYSSSSNGRVEMMELRSKGNNLRRTPSLPPCFGGEGMAEEDAATEEEEPRMADLIRQAMLCGRRLVKAPSLPPCRTREEGGGDRGGRIELNRRRSISLPGKGGRTSKLTRRASINSSLDLPPRHSSKGMKSNSNARKDKQQIKQEVPINKSESNSNTNHRDLNRSRWTKRISDLGHEEVEGFEDVGFTFEEDDLNISISTILSNLQVKDNIEEETDKKLRSTSAKKTMKDEALNSLKEIGVMSVERGSPPSPVQALLGGVAAGVIALILYKFTTTIEASLSRQTISDNYSVQQITITVRTIINGLCYLATFVFGINSVGLFLYSGQLAMNSLTEGFAGNDTKTKEKKQPTLANSLSESETNEAEEVSSNESDQSPDVPR